MVLKNGNQIIKLVGYVSKTYQIWASLQILQKLVFNFYVFLTHFRLPFASYAPWKHQKFISTEVFNGFEWDHFV